MATYGLSLYGLSQYGPDQTVDLHVAPLIATAMGYDHIDLTWNSPTGAWTEMRLVRSLFGFPVDANDGLVIGDWTTAAQSATDGDVRPGEWHYYGLFLNTTSGWMCAAIAATLMPKDYGYSDTLMSALPPYYQYLPTAKGEIDGSTFTTVNDTLQNFLTVLALGFNTLKTQYDSLLYLNDPMKANAWGLAALADQLGIEYEAAAPTTMFRERVKNAGVLARQKGTLEQLRTLVSLTTGYDVDLTMSNNIMLNEDTASFVHPNYPEWDAGQNYNIGERVQFDRYVYQAIVGVVGNPPSGLAATNNTWWQCISGLGDTSLVDSNGAYLGWEPTTWVNGQIGTLDTTNAQVRCGIGFSSLSNGDYSSPNSLMVTNQSATTKDVGARSISHGGSATWDPTHIMQWGVPIPICNSPWDSGRSYVPGNMVKYMGYVYRAMQASTGVSPNGLTTATMVWQCVGIKDRVAVTASTFAQTAALDGSSSPTYLELLAFDPYGAPIDYLDTDTIINNDGAIGTANGGQYALYDSFATGATGVMQGRKLDVGTQVWSVASGAVWHTSSLHDGLAWPTTNGMVTMVGAADGQLAVTFDSTPLTGVQSVIFRKTGNTFFQATQTGLSYYNGTSYTSLGNYSTALVANDRITVLFQGSQIKVYRNGTQVFIVTNTLNQTATTHGLMVA